MSGGGQLFLRRLAWRTLIRNREALLNNATRPVLRAMRETALDLYETALAAVDPRRAVKRHLRREGDLLTANGLEFPLRGGRAVRLLAFGKASVPMARAAVEGLPVEEGLVVTHQKGEGVDGLEVITAGHPVLDGGSQEAGRLALEMADRCGPKDLLLVLLSGGGSSLLEATDLPLRALQELSRRMLRSGMGIEEANTVRAHLSRLKGGQLGVAASRRGGHVLTLAVSDVVGDPPHHIASGPTVGDPTTFGDARGVLVRHGLWEELPPEVRDHLKGGMAGSQEETPKPGDRRLERCQYLLVATNAMACEAVRREAVERGYGAVVLTSHLRGRAGDAGGALASLTRAVEAGFPPPPASLVAGGETTVVVRGEGVGGRCQELALAAAYGLRDREAVLLACGTDGRDGETDAAGALVDGDTWARAERGDLDVRDFLARNDSHAFFRRLRDTIETGATGTNVMDLHILLVGASGQPGSGGLTPAG